MKKLFLTAVFISMLMSIKAQINEPVAKLESWQNSDFKAMVVKDPETFFGKVNNLSRVQVPDFKGYMALIALRDSPGKFITLIFTSKDDGEEFQTILETALATGNLVQITASLADRANYPQNIVGTSGNPLYNMVSYILLYNTR